MFVENKSVTYLLKMNFLLQTDQINMAVLFCYLVKSDASIRYCTVVYVDYLQDKSHFTRYQKYTTTDNWSPCRAKDELSNDSATDNSF